MRNHFTWAFVAFSACSATSSASALAHGSSRLGQGVEPVPGSAATGWAGETGTASYYAVPFQGRKTSSGAHFDQAALTAAHSWLPFGTKVRVTSGYTGRLVIVTITDRIYSTSRIVDLSLAAAQRLGMVRRGIAHVSLGPA